MSCYQTNASSFDVVDLLHKVMRIGQSHLVCICESAKGSYNLFYA